MRRLSGELLTRQSLRLEHLQGCSDAARDFLARRGVRLGNAAELIAGRSPERILRLGFAVLQSGGRAVTSVGSVAEGEQVEIEVSDGKINATVNSGKYGKKEVTYAEAMAEIEKILARLRNEEMDVDSLAAEVKRATELIASCKGAAAQGRSRREQDFRVIPLHA